MKKTITVKKQSDSIAENLKRLKHGKECVALRMQELVKLQTKLQEELRKCTIVEEKWIIKSTFEDVRGVVAMLKKWDGEFDGEISRVSAVLDAIDKDDIEKVRKAFRTYVLSDTGLSIKNITMGLYDFDELIVSAKEFVKKI